MAAPTSRPARPSAGKRNVTLDLATLERGDTPDPFTVGLPGGVVVTLISVEELDWQVAASLSEDRPHQLFEAVVPPEQYEAFIAAKFPLWKMRVLGKMYREHYELTEEQLAGNFAG